MLACLAVLLQMSLVVQAIGSVIVVFGVVWYVVYAHDRALSESLVGEAIAPEPAMADGQGHYSVVIPVANPETERDLLRMAAASAHAHDDENAEVVAVNVIEVPQQTSLSQNLAFEEERVERQRELLDSARDIAAELDVGLRTRAIVGRNAGSVILDVIEEENADHVLLGWQGTRSRREHVLGSTIDPVVGRAPCDATLVKLGPEGGRAEGDIMVLAGEGPHAPVAARRAAEFVATADGDATLTLFNVQDPDVGDDEGPSPEERGEAVIENLVELAGIKYMAFETRIGLAEDVQETVLAAAPEYDTICVGATRSGVVSQAVFGSLPEAVGEKTDRTVVMARGPEESPMSVREAIVRRLDV